MEEEEKEKIIEAAVCPFCACLCDDVVISVDVEGNKIKEVRNACKFGVKKFLSPQNEGRLKKPVVDGKETDYERAIGKAVEILRKAKKPLVYGLSNSGYNAQRVALEIAKQKKGVYDITESICHNLLYPELRKGKKPFYYALLDEIRDNANTIIYWGSNPVESHPRHLSRFAVYPVGRYAMRGVLDREMITIDVVDSELKKLSSWFLRVNPGAGGGDAKIAEIMTRLVKGETNGLGELVEGGIDLDTVVKIADRLKKAFYGVIFVGLGVFSSENASKKVEAILSLVDALNKEGVKFVLFPMKGHFNVVGAVQLLLRETGYPYGVDFSRDRIFVPGKTTVLDVIERGEVDAALIVGADPYSSFPRDKVRKLCDIPLIVIDPFESPTTIFSSVAIPTAITGVETDAIAYRMDGLPLKLDKIVDCEYPSDMEILERIYEGVVESL